MYLLMYLCHKNNGIYILLIPTVIQIFKYTFLMKPLFALSFCFRIRYTVNILKYFYFIELGYYRQKINILREII